MKKTTTILELEKQFDLSKSSIVWLFKKNGIKPISTKDVYIDKIKQPRKYYYCDVEEVLSIHKAKQEPPTEVVEKNYEHSFICMILRPHNVNSLSGKLVKDWNNVDWNCFEKLKNQKLNEIEVNY